jgi:sialidase-1
LEQFVMIPLEEHGKNGFASYRIPGIVNTAAGSLLAYYETRTSKGDWCARGIGLKRSTDGGKSWSERTMIAYDPEMTVGNPVMIAARDGLVHFLWLKDMRQPFYQVSSDDGLTFSEPISLLDCMNSYRSELDWSLFAFGPGHGIELDNGRLLVPVWLCNGEGNNHYPTQITTIISDDKGKTWQRGEIIYGDNDEFAPFANPNETQAVQLTNGNIMLNIRHSGTDRHRYVSISQNGQDNFATPYSDQALPDPRCFGSILRSGRNILFVNCANNIVEDNGKSARTNLTVRMSNDDAKTWKYSRKIAYYGGYADIAASEDGQWIYCFFEHDWVNGSYIDPERLTFCRFTLDWLYGRS